MRCTAPGPWTCIFEWCLAEGYGNGDSAVLWIGVAREGLLVLMVLGQQVCSRFSGLHSVAQS